MGNHNLGYVYRAGILSILLCVCSLAKAQENLQGKWLTYAVTYRGKKITLEEKQEKTSLILEPGRKYVKHYYAYNTGSDPSRLTYHLMSGRSEKVEDATGKVLKKKKIREEGSYQVHEDSIVFVTGSERYAVKYRLQGGTLNLTQLVHDSLSFTLKFKPD